MIVEILEKKKQIQYWKYWTTFSGQTIISTLKGIKWCQNYESPAGWWTVGNTFETSSSVMTNEDVLKS